MNKELTAYSKQVCQTADTRHLVGGAGGMRGEKTKDMRTWCAGQTCMAHVSAISLRVFFLFAGANLCFLGARRRKICARDTQGRFALHTWVPHHWGCVSEFLCTHICICPNIKKRLACRAWAQSLWGCVSEYISTRVCICQKGIFFENYVQKWAPHLICASIRVTKVEKYVHIFKLAHPHKLTHIGRKHPITEGVCWNPYVHIYAFVKTNKNWKV